ncbi:MAG: hypothetical protein GXO54_07585 [Chloroflexi bacterium]|nr:hypothetical protein [Chloroflexota bacterium]
MSRRLERLITQYYRGRIPLEKFHRYHDYPWMFVLHMNSEAYVLMPAHRWSDDDQREEEPFQAWCLQTEDKAAIQELVDLASQHGLEVHVQDKYVFARREHARYLERLLRRHGWQIREQMDDLKCRPNGKMPSGTGQDANG